MTEMRSRDEIRAELFRLAEARTYATVIGDERGKLCLQVLVEQLVWVLGMPGRYTDLVDEFRKVEGQTNGG